MDLFDYKPKRKLINKNLLSLSDYSQSEIYEILCLAIELKKRQYACKKHLYLKDKTIAMIFNSPSTKTRVSFEQGIRQLGAYPMLLASHDIKHDLSREVCDMPKVFQRYGISAIVLKEFTKEEMNKLCQSETIPIINGYACQPLSDMLTIYELFGRLDGLKLNYFGDGTSNNVIELMHIAVRLGVHLTICSHEDYLPNAELLADVERFGNVTVTSDINLGLSDADIIYTNEYYKKRQDKEKIDKLLEYQVNSEILQKAKKDVVFMHSLPAKRGEEVSSDVIASARSVVFEQAENRLHVQKAVLSLLVQ